MTKTKQELPKISLPDLPKLPFDSELASLRKELQELEDKSAALHAELGPTIEKATLGIVAKLNDLFLLKFRCKLAIAAIEEAQPRLYSHQCAKRNFLSKMEVK